MPAVGGPLGFLAEKFFPNTYRPRYNIFLPYYHNIADVNPPHTRYLFDIPGVQKFTEDMDFLVRNFEPVDLATVIQAVESGEPLKKPSFHVTFDDGLRELYDFAGPIMAERGISATFFICSQATDNKRLLYTNIFSLIQNAAAESGRYPKEFADKDPAEFRRYARNLVLQQSSQRETLPEIKHLQDFYEIDEEAYLREHEPFLTTSQIHELAAQGFAFGSHSHSHHRFQIIDLEEASRQIAKSTAFIRDELQLPCESFAFPFYDNNVSHDKYAALRDNGIRISFGTSAPKWDTVDFSLQRFTLNARFAHRPAIEALRHMSAKSFSYRLLNRRMMQRPAS